MITRLALSTRKFSSRAPKFENELELRAALIKSGFLHARKVGFNDQCLVEACKDYEYPSVSLKSVQLKLVGHCECGQAGPNRSG
jgi:hypothetical protein